MPLPRGNRIIEHLNKEVRVRITNGEFVGHFKAFDKHMNLVLSQTYEVRYVRIKGEDSKPGKLEEERRSLGTIVIRGEFVVSMTIIGQGTAKVVEGDGAKGMEPPPKPRRRSPTPPRREDRGRREDRNRESSSSHRSSGGGGDRSESADSSKGKSNNCKTQ